MPSDPDIEAHRAWIGLAQPVGLVVAPAALLQAGVVLPERVGEAQTAFRRLVGFDEEAGTAQVASVRDLLHFLEWPEQFIVRKDDWGELQVPVPEYNDTLVPSLAVKDPDDSNKFILLIKEVPDGADLDATGRDEGNGRWHASHQARLERLLKATGIPIGLLFNATCARLVYAPQGESSGYVTFPFKTLCDTANRPMLAALLMLLGGDRLFTLPTPQRLPALLAESRKYQNTVTEKLAEQVLAALNDLLDGIQQADKSWDGVLLRDVVREQPQLVYEGLVSVMMRLVFLLYAEERGVLPQDPYYQDNYGVLRLFERLRDDDALYPDNMGQRFGAWAQLMTLFRMVFEGMHYEVNGKSVVVPPRQGDLFSPDRFGFLEGRPLHVGHKKGGKERLPMVPDATVFRVLRNLLILDGERLSYRALDVEQIGSVYEALMGFELAVAKGPSMALRPDHVVVDLQELLDTKPANREKKLGELADVKVTGEAQKALKSATTVEQLKATLERRKSDLTQRDIGPGDLYFQVTNERRRSGSHYTPRSLTEPIVATTLKPLVDAIGPNPTPQQIQDLKVCDPAMGSGAFLVAACRWLGDRLLAAWQAYNAMPRIPPDEDPVLHARRIVSLNCLYGVDKNRFAVNLAKLSLWLATLAKDHPFTFLDHALKQGDSLVGLDLTQISCLSWDTRPAETQVPLAGKTAHDAVKEAENRRADLRALGDTADTEKAKYFHHQAEEAAHEAELIGDHIVAAFFGGENAKARKKKLDELAALLNNSKKLPPAELDGLQPFHWQLEFPEVFTRLQAGFDAVVGNPPFLGGKRISSELGDGFASWLEAVHSTNKNADLVAHFFRRSDSIIGKQGAVGLVATNTLAQGDTRAAALQPLLAAGNAIFKATRSMPWPGAANVAVSVVHMARGLSQHLPTPCLDGCVVGVINSRLRGKPERPDPVPLAISANLSFQGSIVLGMGFTLTPEEREVLVKKNPQNAELIFPYLGGEDLNSDPVQAVERYVINFGDMAIEQASEWPELLSILRENVKPERATKSKEVASWPWWQFWRTRGELYAAIGKLPRCLCTSIHSKHLVFSFLPTSYVFSHAVMVFAIADNARFAVLQSRVHELWARLLSSSLEDRLRYSASDCFETFPFPHPSALTQSSLVEAIGFKLHEARGKYMVATNQGLTATYNQLKDAACMDERISELRASHEEMDRAVLRAYGWDDIKVPPFATPTTDSGRKELEAFEDEVIDRLFALNAERAAEEMRPDTPTVAVKSAPSKKRGPKKSSKELELNLK